MLDEQFQNGGEYDLSDVKLQDTVGIKPQNWRTKGTQFWELQKGHNSKAGTALDKILFRIWYLCWNLTEWEDFLFDFAGGGPDIGSVLNKFQPNQTVDILNALKGRELVAKTDVSLRQTFPVVTREGLIFSRQGGIIHQGEKVRIAEVQVFTTERNRFSQIWLRVISEQ